MIDPQLLEEIAVAMRRLKDLSEELKKDSGRALRAGAKIILQEIQDRAPVGSKPHKRYGTPKLDKRIRAPKGMGRVVATYLPGNLEKSFGIMAFRRSEAVFVGPRVGRRARAAGGYDGYYAHMVDRGTVHSRADNFIRPAVSAGEKEATEVITTMLKKKIDKYNNLK